MTAPSRLPKLGVSGRKGTDNNTQDSFIQTFEFPVTAVASAAAQDTGIAVPSKFFQPISALLYVNTPESTGATQSVTVGTTVDGQSILGPTDVSSAGPVGTTSTGATTGGGTFTWTLGGADYVELDAVAVVTLLCSNG